MPRLRIERSRGGSVSSPQASPQQYCVTMRWKSRLKSSTFAIALSTYSLPATWRRIFMPMS